MYFSFLKKGKGTKRKNFIEKYKEININGEGKTRFPLAKLYLELVFLYESITISI